ncbi:MAG: hypothetical protein KJ941_02455, partial [Bacteroidetes bacterium]|nr:hypothetical protein [Bacteroidota bacterium]
FNVNEFKVAEPLFGGMHTPAVFIKLGHEKFHSSSFGTDFSVKVGYAENIISTNLNRENGVDPYRVNSTYVEPVIGLILVSDEQTAFKFNFSFATYGFGFRPNYLGLKSNSGYNKDDFSTNVTYISVGFSYVHYFRMH